MSGGCPATRWYDHKQNTARTDLNKLRIRLSSVSFHRLVINSTLMYTVNINHRIIETFTNSKDTVFKMQQTSDPM